MKITIYELLGLVKDGKAPEKIKFRNEIYEYENNIKDSFIDYVGIEKETNEVFYLSSYIGNNYISDIFTDEVEIIEEQEDKEDKIQKIYHCETSLIQNEVEIFIIKQLNQMVDKINELIDEINNLKEK
jgi:RecG-like helicase